MSNTYEFTTESQGREFWHHLLDQMGIERLMAQCSINVDGGIIKITVRA